MRYELKFVTFITKYFYRQKQYNFTFEINNYCTQYFFIYCLFLFTVLVLLLNQKFLF